ncbi:hypothetical protein IIZ77_01290 [Candidatus Saccharibacteria bacterium]|nr:hypothetical protein [Candidatus Saccharibacteria bacterium]
MTIDYTKLDALLKSEQQGDITRSLDRQIGEEFQLVILSNQVYKNFGAALSKLRLDTDWKTNEYFNHTTNQFAHNAWFGLAFVDKLDQVPLHPSIPIKFHFDFAKAMSDIDYRNHVVAVIAGEETEKVIQGLFKTWTKAMSDYCKEVLKKLKTAPAEFFATGEPYSPIEAPEKYLFTGTKEITI